MKTNMLAALAIAAAVFTGLTYSRPAQARGCYFSCQQQYNLCLANTPHAAQSCREFRDACFVDCDFQ